MKYTFISIGALLIAVGLSILIVFLLNKAKKLKIWINALTASILSIVLSVSFSLIYFAFNYKASENAEEYLKSDEVVEVVNDKSYYQFDNINNDDTAIIFYGGGKVEEASYAPLCSQIAHKGIDVYLVKFPLHFPLINAGSADKIAKNNKYNNLYMMGHSLGGTTASIYLSKTSYEFKGIIFLAAYSTNKLDDSLKCLSIYGSNDSVLNKEEYSKNTAYFPNGYRETIIEGGNHSNFGDYGLQRRDTKSSISKDKQIEITTSEVVSFIML